MTDFIDTLAQATHPELIRLRQWARDRLAGRRIGQKERQEIEALREELQARLRLYRDDGPE